MLGRRNIKTLEIKLGIDYRGSREKIMSPQLEIVKVEQNSTLVSKKWLKSQSKNMKPKAIGRQPQFLRAFSQKGGTGSNRGGRASENPVIWKLIIQKEALKMQVHRKQSFAFKAKEAAASFMHSW